MLHKSIEVSNPIVEAIQWIINRLYDTLEPLPPC